MAILVLRCKFKLHTPDKKRWEAEINTDTPGDTGRNMH